MAVATEQVDLSHPAGPAEGGSGGAKLPHLSSLDGWRGISILLVLACHMLPLGPHRWQLNVTAGAAGMSLFFTLSGFLITSFMIRRPEVKPFLIRRLCRILPLAWGYLFIVLCFFQPSVQGWIANFLFLINYKTQFIHHAYNSHFWSLCLEIHFYLGIALIVWLFGKRGLYLIPLFCLGITALRVVYGIYMNIQDQFRMDEILAGAWLALIYAKQIPMLVPLRKISPWLLIAGLFISSHPWGWPLYYVRPYMGAMLVGCTLYQPEHWLSRHLGGPILKYIAATSYALYVVHPITMYGWMGSGNKWSLYLFKRPISFMLTFLLAHISTFYWEKKWTQWGRRITTIKKQPELAVA